MFPASKKPSLRLLCLAALILGAGAAAAFWLTQRTSAPAAERGRERERVVSGIVTTAIDSHQPAGSYSKAGDIRTLPADPALEEALSHTSRLAFPLRLKAVHNVGRDLASRPLTAAQADHLRAFVADLRLPEGLTIQQVRALKNDVLNVLCLVPGGESATAAILRTLYADETADPGLRDYALQHLVTLTERDPSLGWEAHWKALEGDNPALAATALIHLSIHLRSQVSGVHQAFSGSQVSGFQSQVSSTAFRLASDPAAPDPARTTALQVCGQLKLTEARQLAYDLARSDRASMPLRIAAVATLGDLGGDDETRAYLTALTTGSEKRLRIPADGALKKLTLKKHLPL